MYHENENDTFENVLPKYRITREEEIVINQAAEAYQVHKFLETKMKNGRAKITWPHTQTTLNDIVKIN